MATLPGNATQSNRGMDIFGIRFLHFFFFFCMGDFFFLLLVCFPGLQGPSESVLLLHKTQIKSDIC